MKKLKSVAAVISALGGDQQIAADYDLWPQAISNWRLRKRMPPRLYHAMSQDLAKLEQWAPPKLWQQVEKSA